MITLTTIRVRSTLTTPWGDYFMPLQGYRDSGKIVDVIEGVSEDGFQWLRTIIFRGTDEYQDWCNDPDIYTARTRPQFGHDHQYGITVREIKDERRV